MEHYFFRQKTRSINFLFTLLLYVEIFASSFLYVNILISTVYYILIFTVSHHVYTHVQLVEKSEGIAYGLKDVA